MRRILLLILVVIAVPLLMGALVTREQVSTSVAIDDSSKAGSVDLGTSSADYTLPQRGDPYMVCAIGNTAYVTCGASPTVSIAAGGYTFSVQEGACIGPMPLKGPKCAHIASSAAGQIVFIHFDPDY